MKNKLLLFGLMLALFAPALAARALNALGNGLTSSGNTQYVSLTNYGNIAPTNEITIEFWANVASAANANDAEVLLMPDQYPTNRVGIFLAYPDTGTYWEFGNISSGEVESTTPNFILGTWTHFACVASHANNSMTIYTNGNVFATHSGSSFFTRGTFELRVGGFNGSINDFRMWNVARSQAQIQAALGSPLVGNESGLVLYYRLNNSSGAIATNSATATGTTYNGTVVGSPSWVTSPMAVTSAGSGATSNSATLVGGVYAGQYTANYFFQYGLNTGYGSVTPVGSVGAATTFYTYLAVSNTLSGLAMNTVYHYRLVASNSFGTNAGLDQELITLGGNAWTALSNTPPSTIGHMHLLTDGTVFAEYSDFYGNGGPVWYRLTPDIHGSYINGTWSTNASMSFTHQDFASQVLQSGKVMVAGGEDGTGHFTSELYDPVSNTWTTVTIPPAWLNTNGEGIGDADSMLLPDGTMMVSPVVPATNFTTFIYHPSSNGWSVGPSTIGNQNEASWVKLPDDSILTIDLSNPFSNSTNSERYIPGLGKWVQDANVPVEIFSINGAEAGPALLLPNGKAIFFGGNTSTAIYTPSPLGGTNFGTWITGPSFPDGVGMPDASAAMLPDGNILMETAPQPVTGGALFLSPVSFFEFNYLNNTFTQVGAPGGGATYPGGCWPNDMLMLPDGNVLFSTRSTNMYVYHPNGGSPLVAGQPAIQSVTMASDGSLTLFGTLFNGISAGAVYGDDEQEDSNYPLARFTDSTGKVRYGRTYNWSRTSVATGTNVLFTSCAIPAGASLQDTIQVVANGIASAGVHYPLYYSGATIYVDYSFSGTQLGTQANPFNTIHQGYSFVENGGIISIAGGHNTTGGDGHIRISNPVRIISTSGTASIGPN